MFRILSFFRDLSIFSIFVEYFFQIRISYLSLFLIFDFCMYWGLSRYREYSVLNPMLVWTVLFSSFRICSIIPGSVGGQISSSIFLISWRVLEILVMILQYLLSFLYLSKFIRVNVIRYWVVVCVYEMYFYSRPLSSLLLNLPFL